MSTASMTKCSLMTAALVAALLSAPAVADQPAIPRIGVHVVPLANSPHEAGLRDGLRELGYVEGTNIVINWWRSTGATENQRSVVADLARSKPDVLVVFSTLAARAALEVTTTIPIVFLSGDPVTSGLAQSLAHPGGNATGVSVVVTELTAKRLEFLRLLAPRARRIACLMNSSNPSGVQQLEAAQQAARTLGVQLVTLDARNAVELDAALRALQRGAADGVLVTGDILFRVNRSKVTQAVRKARLPATFPFREYHEDRALMSYGPNLRDTGRKMAVYVDKILKGAKPADLPIEQMSKYELVVDLRVARELGLDVPQELLLSADEVIK